MLKGHLQTKNGYFYMVIPYKDGNGRWKSKWKSTGLKEKGNKKRAEAMLKEELLSFEIPVGEVVSDKNGILFSDYMRQWLDGHKHNIVETTYSGYSCTVNGVIRPYFEEKGTFLTELKPYDLKEFYDRQRADRGVSGQTLLRYHACIRKALDQAVRLELIPSNPADKIDRPKGETYRAEYYTKDELNLLFKACKGEKIFLAVLTAAFYGLRRGEVIGLKWDAIDFENNTLTIKHTVTVAIVDGKQQLVAMDRAKTKSSLRTLPLAPNFKKMFQKQKEWQEKNKKRYGNSYSKKFTGYIFVDELGELMKPDFLSDNLKRIIEKNGLKPVRLHALRHSCASLMLANGVPMKQIQDWLGHSNFSTTANLYAHLDATAKLDCAEKILNSGLELSM